MANILARKNKDGVITSYTIRVYRGYDIAGKRLKPFSTSYKPAPEMTAKQIEKELNRVAIQFEQECKNGLIGNATKITLDEYSKQYLEVKKQVLSPSTHEFYSNALRRSILPALGHHKMEQIKSIHVQAYINQLCAMPLENGGTLSISTVKRYLSILQSVFKLAVKQRIVISSPAKAELLEIPKAVTPKIEIFNKQEATEMLTCLEQEKLQFQVLIQLAILTGARRGELVALKFSDFDFDNKKMTISRATVKVKGQPAIIKPPKDYEVRTVSVSSFCIELVQLLKIEKEQERERLGTAWHEGDWLFTQWNGEMMGIQTPTRWFAHFLSRNNLKHKKFHSLRHTSATLLLYGGVNIKQVQERLGHGDIETTNKYLHYLTEADEQATDILQNMLKPKGLIKLDKHA